MSVRGGVTAPQGFLASASDAGIQAGRASGRDDLALVVSDRPAVAAGTFTTNQVRAAPVVWSEAIVRSGGRVRAILLNSGNANACTGAPGSRAVRRSAAAVARAIGLRGGGQVLIASTGVIGVAFPIERVLASVEQLASGLGGKAQHGAAAARAIMTTDTFPKQHAARARWGGRICTVGGMAKGAGMIHPQMATMLSVLTTDAPLGRRQAQRLLAEAVESSFNSITVDGDTSTNDCVLLLANGAAGGRVPAGGAAERAVAGAIEQVCRALAARIASDGEGASKLISVHVKGAPTQRDARMVARTVASSLLVKTAVHGGDPNWGRVLAAAGRSGVRIDPSALALRIGGCLVARSGAAYQAGERGAARHLRGRRVEMELRIGKGPAQAVALGSDLSADYVSINSSYRS